MNLNCPHINLTPEVIKFVNQFKSDEDLLRSGGLPNDLLDRLAFGFTDEDIKTLNPNQLHVKWHDDMENVKWEQQQSGLSKIAWAQKIDLSEPIDVVYEKNKFYIDDGHHRTYAAKILKKLLNVNLEIKMNPITQINPNLDYDLFHRCLFNQVKNNQLNEELSKIKKMSGLNESLTNVEDDVNMIYDTYFREPINVAMKTRIITPSMFDMKMTDTSILKNPMCVKANEINPCEIRINFMNNYYNPFDHIISIALGSAALRHVENFNCNIDKAIEDLMDIPNQAIAFKNEFSEARIKGSIHHELTHWLDDTLNNNHIKNHLTAAQKKAEEDQGSNLSYKPINVHHIERQAQIHNIKQLYNQNKDIWNTLSFDEMIKMAPSLSFVKNLPYNIKAKWIKDMKMRMYREGLLGKEMFN